MFTIKFSENSILDLIKIQEYYDKIVFGLGKKFISKLDEVVIHLKSNPKIYPIVKNKIRKALMNEFPYAIFFTILNSSKEIIIVAIIHTSRNPNYWKSKVLE